jgi:hypothetical protein
MARFTAAAALLVALAATPLHARNDSFSGLVKEFEASTTVVVLMETNPPKTERIVLGDGSEGETARFRVVEVLKGTGLKLGAELELLAPPLKPLGRYWYAQGVNAWPYTVPLDDLQATFIQRLAKLPKKGTERLAFFQEYLQSADEDISFEALFELERASWADVRAFKSSWKREVFLARIKDPKRRPYEKSTCLKLLSVCGTADDVPMLEKMLSAADEESKRVLHGVVTAYVGLRGVEGLDSVDKRFLTDAKTPYADVFQVVRGLRDVSEGSSVIPRERMIRSLRQVLDRSYGDIVVADLGRLEDWDSMDRLVKMFKASEDSSFLRIPVIQFLMACPKPEAKAHLEELKKLDPPAFERAKSFFEVIKAKDKDAKDE